MSTLTLTVLRCPEPASTQRRRMQGGSLTLGRHEDCDWPLPDPLRSLSRKHCTVEFYGGVWQVRDLSANGTRINGEAEPVGNGLTRQLRDSDRLLLGDYEIEVRIEDPLPTLSGAFGGAFGGVSPFGGPDAPTSVFGPGAHRGAGAGFGGARLPGLDDPPPFQPASLEASPFGASPLDASPFGAVQSDHAAAGDTAYAPPAVVPAGLPGGASPAKATPTAGKHIPDNWFDLEESQLRLRTSAAVPPAVPSAAVPPEPPPLAAVSAAVPTAPTAPTGLASPAAERVTPPAAAPSAGFATTGPAGAPAAALAAFLAGADLPPDLVVRAASNPEEALHNAGALLRATVSGMRSLLIARGTVKREFRIEQTMIRTRENNPLKFATSDEQAMAALLDPRTAALSAVQESITDLTGHQVAVMAATQAAARALLKELEPERLLAEDAGGGFLPGALEKRLWDAYKRRHAQLIEQFEDDLKSAFGTAFARAYEDAVGRGRN